MVGIILIVPPQVYFERVSTGAFTGSYWDFWPAHAFSGVYPEGNFSWHHLWFLPYLLVFSLILIPLFLYLRRNPNNKAIRWIEQQVKNLLGLFWFLLPLFATHLFLRPYFPPTHALIGDWFTLVYYGILFLYGFVLVMVKDVFWETVRQNRRLMLMIAVVAFSCWLLLLLSFNGLTFSRYLQPLVKVVNCWSWILVLFGYAAHYLNKDSAALSYANQAVYPFYILHQTVTVSLGFYIRDLDWPLGQKALFLVAGTFMKSWALYQYLIRRIGFLRYLFGLKPKPGKGMGEKELAEAVPTRM